MKESYEYSPQRQRGYRMRTRNELPSTKVTAATNMTVYNSQPQIN